MKKSLFSVPATAILFGLLTAAGALIAGGPAWGAPGPAPPPGLFNTPLNQIPVPEPPNLFQFVKSKPAAIRLGKALFWDMQVGSDGVQACASCHFSAGADNRKKNTVNPGTRGGDTTFQVRGPNETLELTDFPFHQRQDPDFQASPIIRDSNDVVGSQGVKLTTFLAINGVTGEETGKPVADTVFQVGGISMRRVTARNTPTNINAVFNFHNFWDGRAHFIFNGVNPFGPLDQSARVWFNSGGVLVPQPVAIEAASLASQATGPPLDDTEMSASGRTFPQLGRKMLSLTPLGRQAVHPGDSVLGPLSRAVLLPDGKIANNKGLNANYAQMIRDAFQDNLTSTTLTTPDGFTQMEANFSLFWGLAIQLYEATLISDQTPFDRFLGGDQTALTAQQANGMNLFFGPALCSACHAGTELTSASVTSAAFISNIDNGLIDQMVAGGIDSIYDIGFNSTAVRRMTEDIARGGNSPFDNQLTGQKIPLGYCAQSELQAVGNLPFQTPFLPPQVPASFPVSNDGAFKVPGLRNVELTAPYFHDGSVMTLEDVVDFYTRGGNFPAVADSPDLDPNIRELGMLQNQPAKVAELVAFMKSLTDERVRNESAPFDHPELLLPEGDPEILVRIPARNASGQAALLSNFAINPVTTPTNQSSLTISGTKEAGTTIQVKVNNGAPIPAQMPTDTTWSAAITGLVQGGNIIAVTATEPPPASAAATLTTTITLDTTQPALTINAVATPVRITTQAVSGTVEAGITPVVTVGTPATVGPVTVSGATWSAQLSGLKMGTNSITVTATDPAGNVASVAAAIVISPDGIFNGTSVPDISDAIRALRIAVGLITPTANDLVHGDVAPLGAPDGTIDITDVVLIMRNVIGSVSL